MEQSKHSEGITSVKVHHQPGGASSFSIAHDDTDDRWGNSGKVGSNNVAPKTNQSAAAAAQQQSSIFSSEEQKQNAPSAGPGAFTSVKYSGNPPGGKSQGLW
jgi:hypothetical protein